MITVNKEELLQFLLDAYQYHAIKWQERSKKVYKNETKKAYNSALIDYHFNKMQELNAYIETVKKDNGE